MDSAETAPNHALAERLGERAQWQEHADGPALEVAAADLLEVMSLLRDDPEARFEQLMDLAGMDYAEFGQSEWKTEQASATGFSRAVHPATSARYSFDAPHPPISGERRFAVVYHLLSLSRNQRLRVRAYCEDGEWPSVPSVRELWRCADWYEREAFDLFGIVFEGHPDLRRILTDYGFIGHPLRRDFPLSGHMEVRYDPELRRVVYEPVSIEARVGVPRVLRETA